ncbi:hypothetical protein AURDEDRAFT_176567 [Auricularia subglabra TFB-10046 SS5]|uniref:Uncharacterized protein n=1 Tax=Auricularia subglabra (strain TFB-10046 / SS5) TaxID=717982 RepID=J0CVE7_AURST|nr:hypothetical protein AURDEDRAFT_176567 [Auricularia subglabra TFB-10046 SS5]
MSQSWEFFGRPANQRFHRARAAGEQVQRQVQGHPDEQLLDVLTGERSVTQF